MRIGIIGGTGKEGTGLGVRWARKGHTVLIGSREAEKAQAHARALADAGHGFFEGGDNAWAAGGAEVVVLSVPYAAHAQTLAVIKPVVTGKVIIDVTVPLKPPKVTKVQLPIGRAAALEAQEALGITTPVVAALHHVGAAHLIDPDYQVHCDVLIATDNEHARVVVSELVRELGLRALDAGPLDNAIALESLTPVLIHLNKKYRATTGIVISDLPEGAGRAG